VGKQAAPLERKRAHIIADAFMHERAKAGTVPKEVRLAWLHAAHMTML
jgi:hypothetical protein